MITGTEDRQHAYVALSRGTDVNLAYVFTASPKTRRPGPRPAPGPRARPLRPPRRRPAARPLPPPPPADPLAVLAGVLDRDGQQHSATQTRRQALADADHLAILHAIWAAETTPARDQRYHDLLMTPCRPATAGNPATRPSGCGAPCAPPNWPAWTPPVSWPTRSPNGTWPDPATSPPSSTPASATGSASWSRFRPGPWSEQVPALADPERRAYVAEIAALMDARKDRIGEHAAGHPPPWATAALGPVPDRPPDRLAWQKRAAAIGAWRELSGYDHPADPIGPEPAAAAPDVRAAWHEALAALGPADGPDVRGMPDGRLLHLRDTYPSKPPGHPSTSATSSARSAPPPGTPAWPACAPPPRPAPPPRAATEPAPRAGTSWPPLPGHGRAYRQRDVFAATPWPTAPTGTTPPAPSASWPSPPTPNYAAATPASTSRRCAPPNPSPPASGPARATSAPAPAAGEIDQWINDLAAAAPGLRRQLADRQSQMVPSEAPATATSARRSPPGPARAGSRSCSRPCPRSRPPRGSSTRC